MFKINIRLKNVVNRQRILGTAGLLLLIIASAAGPLAAQSVLQGYASDETLQRGMLVATAENDEGKVITLTRDNQERMKGVVVERNDSPVTLSSEDRKIFVATSGTYEMLVTNENGVIKKGDLLSISSLSGIAMKADDRQVMVVGRAANVFTGEGDTIGTSDTKDGRKLQFGRIPVDIEITRNPTVKIPEKDKIPDAIQKFSETVADKPVSSVRIYIGMAVIFVTAVISGTMLYSGTRSSMISIGRNPLSKTSIYRGLIQVVLLSLIIFISGIFGVYLLLKL